MRQAAFKEETIMEGMLVEDYMNSAKQVELGAKKMVYSPHFPARDMDNKLDQMLGWIQYTWYVQARPIALRTAAIATTLCTLIVIVAECTFYF